MSTVEQQLRKATADMVTINARFAVVGGLAVSARAEPRMTRDADLAVAVRSDQEAEQVIFAMQRLGYSVLAVVEEAATGRMSTVRLETTGSVITDLLFASSGIEQDIVERATMISVIPGLILPVACVGDLIAMKLLARDDRQRPTDADDLRALREVATEADWKTARIAVTSIEANGYARQRDLLAALNFLLVSGAYGVDL
jgi:predicted nucleotidyltransferase